MDHFSLLRLNIKEKRRRGLIEIILDLRDRPLVSCPLDVGFDGLRHGIDGHPGKGSVFLVLVDRSELSQCGYVSH